MQAGRDLARREQPFDVRGRGLGVDDDAAHRVVRGGRHLHRLAGDVEHLVLDELAIHPRQPLEDRLLRNVRHVEEHAAVRAAAAFGDLRVVREGDPIARRQLESLGIVALHVALAAGVRQPATLAAHRLGDEGAGDLLRPQHPGRMELHELHVRDAAARLEGERHAFAVVLVPAGARPAPDPRVAAGREDDGVGEHDQSLARREVDAVGAEARSVADEEARHVDPFEHRHAELRDTTAEGPDDRASRPVAGVARSAVRVRAEEPLVDASVLRPRERTAPVGELVDGRRRLLDEDLDHARVGERVAVAVGVEEVLFDRVVGIARAEDGVHPAGREDGMRVAPCALADDQDVGAGVRRGDGGSEPGTAAPDHEDVRRARALRHLGDHLWFSSKEDGPPARGGPPQEPVDLGGELAG